MRKLRLEEIFWNDHSSASNQGWVKFDDLEVDAYDCRTLGYVVAETKDAVIVVPTVSPGDANTYSKFAGQWQILKPNITRRRKLGEIKVPD